MIYFLWVVIFSVLVLLGGVVFWVMRRPPGGPDEGEEDLTEWICPSCGFHVQMGTECIYCGERKPSG